MRKSKQFAGMPVISMEEGQQIGTVRGLVVDPAQKTVAALIIEQKGWFKEQRFIPFARIHSVGDNAITVAHGSSAQRAAKLPDIVRLTKERLNVLGARIVTENGTALGQVDEYYVDLENGDIIGLEFSGGFLSSVMEGHAFLDSNFIRTLGREVIICQNEALENIVRMEGGLQETMRKMQKSTSQAWGNTRQKTRSLGEAINRTVARTRRDQDDADGRPEQPPVNGEARDEPPLSH
ncbi:PRC-barrel domain-containing protein [Desulfotomaculum copahuensis]|uniref:Photosystem reaction center subunit H n=1 Tax=Desulfotomaculum copahuensis TaxID=1838280 RepID=A0A1B7LFK0_9FIRM|nr:PRC-barrel domain-containing protein [Desulfotomaculum copahuensis]OAT82940.1 photosystem reaction center subunit H [Desulfotomaculum copahuensis]